ncbi:uncharacterized protein LOC131683009 isoform X2 [Topomyia yanbarensis]|nr:uncharacterized protein LOC131683009 isoform X2 [Topomyia yanbarensis]
MRELVVICYSFHKCVFLLRFCTDLASYEPATLRFINNYNSTTSLYQRRTNKLLVTFRNENMLYDQAPQNSSRKYLLPKLANSLQLDIQSEQMVEPAFFDIYLCDDCDAELYSYDAYMEHERVCLTPKATLDESDDDDVIYCGSEMLPSPMLPNDNRAVSSAQSMASFLLNFNLSSRNNPVSLRSDSSSSNLVNNQNINILDGSPEKLRRLPRRPRGVVTLSKCTSIPLSSPCGQFLLKSIKTVMSHDYRRERLERLERFCFAPPLTKDGTVVTNRPKWMTRSRVNTNITISYKKGFDEPADPHSFKFPRRQFSVHCKKRNFLFYNKLLLNKCKPCAIKLERLTAQEIENRNIDIRLKKLNVAQSTLSLENRKSISEVKQVVVDCIDLCSSEDGESDMRYGQSDGFFISGDPVSDDVNSIPQLNKQITNKNKATIEANSSTLPRLQNTIDVKSFLYLDGSKSSNHKIFRPQTPTLHLFSSIRNATTAGNYPLPMPNDANFDASESTSEMNHIHLSNMENMTEVKENRVNDWLNDAAISTENTMHVPQSHLLLTSTTSLASRALSPCSLANASLTVTKNNGITALKSLPSIVKLTNPTGSVNVDSVVRQRTVTSVDIK